MGKFCFAIATLPALFTIANAAEPKVHDAEHAGAVFALAFRPDGTRLATASFDRRLTVWDAGGRTQKQVLAAHQAPLTSLAWSPDGQILVSTDTDGRVIKWCGTEPRRLEGHAACAYAVAFLRDGKSFLTCGQDRRLKVWRTNDGELLQAVGPFDSPLYALAVAPDGQSFAVAGMDGLIRICSHESGSVLRELAGHSGAVFTLAISPDGKHLVSGGEDGCLRVWEFATGHELFMLNCHRDAIYQVNFSASGRRLVSVGASGQVVVWDAGAGMPLFSQRFPGHGFAASFSPDGARLAVAAGSHFSVLELPQYCQ